MYELDLLYCVRIASSLHAACQAFSTRLTHAVSQYLVSMHAQPATTAHHSKGECHHALRAYSSHSTWPTDLTLVTSKHISSVFQERLLRNTSPSLHRAMKKSHHTARQQNTTRVKECNVESVQVVCDLQCVVVRDVNVHHFTTEMCYF